MDDTNIYILDRQKKVVKLVSGWVDLKAVLRNAKSN
jgi:hypothetical protein